MKRIALLLWLCATSLNAWAHEIRPAYLELTQTAPDSYAVLWKVPARGDTYRFGLYVVLPSDAMGLTRPRGEFVGGSFVERWDFRRAGGLQGAVIRIEGLQTTLTDALVRVVRLDGVAQTARLTASAPSFTVEGEPRTLQLAATYLRLGVEHILLGVDHLLFVLALLILVQGASRLIATVTAFTVAHSISLAAATLGWVQAPTKPVEAVIALSILFVALEIVRVREGRICVTASRPWLAAFIFGLLHGLGFASALHEIGLPQAAIPLALLCFNLGVEAGQLLFSATVLLLIAAVQRLPLQAPSWAWRIPPYAIGACASFWLLQRLASFSS